MPDIESNQKKLTQVNELLEQSRRATPWNLIDERKAQFSLVDQRLHEVGLLLGKLGADLSIDASNMDRSVAFLNEAKKMASEVEGNSGLSLIQEGLSDKAKRISDEYASAAGGFLVLSRLLEQLRDDTKGVASDYDTAWGMASDFALNDIREAKAGIESSRSEL